MHTLRHETVPLDAAELFCGYGGATAGMLAAGLSVRLAVDYDRRAVAAHRAWHPGVPVRCQDVRQVRPAELAGRFVWASPSCRPWSLANTSGPRGVAHPEYFDLCALADRAILSHVLVIENVSGLAWTSQGKAELARLWEWCDYYGRPVQLVHAWAHQFGVRQFRRRVFVIVGASSPVVLDQAAMSHAELGHLSHEGQDALSHRAQLSQAVTTRTGGNVSQLAELQGILNPRELLVPDTRSGRRRESSHRLVNTHTSRRLIGNAVPPEMARGVCLAVRRAVGWH